jgi:hypothetical protein
VKDQKPTVLMPVYNQIDYDGRVQRGAEALSDLFDVTVFSIDSGKGYNNPKFFSVFVFLPRLKRLKGVLHLYSAVVYGNRFSPRRRPRA